jgi:GrpB-like predicted nucleotidyltransferase (UPF0157 family)
MGWGVSPRAEALGQESRRWDRCYRAHWQHRRAGPFGKADHRHHDQRPTLPQPDAWSEALINLGYEALGQAGVPGRLYFRLRTRPVCNVHLVEQNGTQWVNNLAFRDYLRQSPGAARQYRNGQVCCPQWRSHDAAGVFAGQELCGRSIADPRLGIEIR